MSISNRTADFFFCFCQSFLKAFRIMHLIFSKWCWQKMSFWSNTCQQSFSYINTYTNAHWRNQKKILLNFFTFEHCTSNIINIWHIHLKPITLRLIGITDDISVLQCLFPKYPLEILAISTTIWRHSKYETLIIPILSNSWSNSEFYW